MFTYTPARKGKLDLEDLRNAVIGQSGTHGCLYLISMFLKARNCPNKTFPVSEKSMFGEDQPDTRRESGEGKWEKHNQPGTLQGPRLVLVSLIV